MTLVIQVIRGSSVRIPFVAENLNNAVSHERDEHRTNENRRTNVLK